MGDPTGSVRKGKRPIRKTARARTVLSEKQLNILKTCYSANPRPDALMKVSLANIFYFSIIFSKILIFNIFYLQEQLVEMTGLSARVIRVWFQNKRCKVGGATQPPEMVIFKSDKILPLTHLVCTGFSFVSFRNYHYFGNKQW